MNVTIKEIAEMAGVHRSTVDKVIHNRIGVSDEVRKKVQRIIDELGYKPNAIGRALKRQQKPIRISAIMAEVDALSYVRAGIEKAYEEFKTFNIEINYHIVKFSNAKEQAGIIDACIQEEVDGMVILPVNTPVVKEAIDRAVEKGIPVITMNSDVEDSKRMCFVGQNVFRAGKIAGRLMGEFLKGKGNVGIISNPDNRTVECRAQGFKQLIQTEYPSIDICKVESTNEESQDAFRSALKMLEKNPAMDGLFITCGGVKDIARAVRGLDLKKRIKVICFEDYDEIIDLMKEEIIQCTITGDLEAQGYEPIKVMFNRLFYDKEPEKEFMETNINILVKESVE